MIPHEDFINISTKILREHLKVTRKKPDMNFVLWILFFFGVIEDVWQHTLRRKAGMQRLLQTRSKLYWQVCAGSLYSACLHYVHLQHVLLFLQNFKAGLDLTFHPKSNVCPWKSELTDPRKQQTTWSAIAASESVVDLEEQFLMFPAHCKQSQPGFTENSLSSASGHQHLSLKVRNQ